MPPLLFNFALEYAIKSVKANKEGTLQHLVYADDIILGGGIHTVNKTHRSFIFP
jgi:hypothetical protein